MTPGRTCGGCVTRNAANELVEFGECSRYGKRHRDDPACDGWFDLAELRKPLYGRSTPSKAPMTTEQEHSTFGGSKAHIWLRCSKSPSESEKWPPLPSSPY